VRNLVTGTDRRYRWLGICLTVGFALLLLPGLALGQTFVQIANNAVNSGTTVAFTNPENAGDLNVVIVGWGDQTSSVTSVTDSNGNTYVLAGTSGGEGTSQAIYYAKNISISTTATPTVSVHFVKALASADVRVAEYTGFSSAAVTVDNWTGNSGGNSPANSNTTTTSTSSLIVGAGTANPDQFNPGGLPGNLTNRGINVFGDVTMDSNGAVAAGAYAASANVSGGWVMQVMGFSIGGISTQTPTVASILPITGSTQGGDSVTITGTNFAPGAVALFGVAPGGISLVNCAVTSSTSMTCNTPADNAGLRDLTVVNVDGKLGSLPEAFTYEITDPTISSLSATTSSTDGGTAITITGTGFEAGALVTVGGPLPSAGTGLFADNIVVKSGTSITITAPAFSVGPEDVTVINPDSGEAVDSAGLTYAVGNGPINYIQRADAATGSSAVTVPTSPMANPQTKGNLNAVIIGWSDTSSQVSSVTDSEGNSYVQALPVTQGSSLSQVIYYAKNILGDNPSCAPTCNVITVNFSGSTSSPDVRALEYSGIDGTSPLDQGVGNAGAGALADTGPCFTTSAVELILSGTTVSTNVTGAGANFTTVDYTNNGDNAEHQIASAVGSCEATTVMTGGNWVTQVITLKAGAAGAPSFTLVADPPTTESVTAGSSASYALTLAAVNGFSSAVTLTCSGLPTGASCGFTPPSPVTPGSSTADALTISTSGSTPGGTSTVTVTGTSGSIVQTATVTLTVTAGPNFTIAAAPATGTIGTPGGSATSTISLTGTGGFNAAVSLACAVTGGGSPAPTCSLSVNSISGSTTSTLTVNTTANTASITPRSTGLLYALLLPIGGMTMLGAGFSSRRKKLLGILLIGMLIAGFMFMTACSSGSSSSGGGGGGSGGGTPAGTYTVTVTGTSGSLSAQTTTFTVTVQ
jgi:IPT/TIG domain